MNLDRIISENFGIKKTEKYSNSSTVAKALIAQNEALISIESEEIKGLNLKEEQLVIISYVPRSGSTLLSQILSSSGNFNYISNFQARYWMAPYIGGKIEQSLNLRINTKSNFKSDFGRTELAYDPSEFNYFWEYWFNYDNENHHEIDDVEKLNLNGLKKQILALMSLEDKPLFFKKEWLGINSNIILKMFPNAKIIHVERDLSDSVNSILKARKEIYGNENAWFGAKTKNYETIKKKDPKTQIELQIIAINERVKEQANSFPDNFLFVKHEDILSNTQAVINSIEVFLNMKINKDNYPLNFMK